MRPPRGARARTKRAEREMDAEARANAVVLEGDDLGDSGAWRNMKQPELPLTEQPIKGAPVAQAELDQSKEEFPDEEEPVAATPNLPATQNFNDNRAASLRQPFDVRAAEIKVAADKLIERRTKAAGMINPFLMAEAQELSERADMLLSDIQNSDLRKEGDVFYKYHRAITGAIAFVSGPANAAKKLFSDFAYSRKQQVERAARDERERLEKLQREADQKAKDAEIARLQAEERHEEAKIVQETPLPPTVAPAAKPVAAIAPGVSVVVSVKLARITDATKLVAFLVKNPMLLLQLFEIKEGAWKTFLTNHYDKKSGEMTLNAEDIGIELEVSGSGRNRKSNGEV